jgi:hypothetical protein
MLDGGGGVVGLHLGTDEGLVISLARLAHALGGH